MTPRAWSARRVLQAAGCGGAVLVALTGCSDEPVRQRTPESVLIELTSATTARVTVEAQYTDGFFGGVPTPRGAPRSHRRVAGPGTAPPSATSTTAGPTSTSVPLTPEQAAFVFAALTRPSAPLRTGLRRPATAVAGVGRLIARDAVVTRVHARPDRVVATLRFTHLDHTIRIAPAAVVRTLRRGGMTDAPVWVGVCTASTRGSWAATPDAFDRQRGCAGWVPARRAVTVGVLHTGSGIATETWMIAILIAGSVVLLAAAVLRATVRPLARIRRLWIAPTVVLVAAIVAADTLIHTADATGAVSDTFGTTVEASTHATASGLTPYAVGLAIAALGVAVWAVSQPAMERLGREFWDDPARPDPAEPPTSVDVS